LNINPAEKRINGLNKIYIEALQKFNKMQLDLYQNMQIDSIVWQGQRCTFQREGNAFFVLLPTVQQGTKDTLTVFYQGSPQIAAKPPWDGGFVWNKDKNNNDWIGVACEGDGASIWFPCKDHLSDRPDSVRIVLEVPQNLMAVANGNLYQTINLPNGYKRYDWRNSYPIATYNMTLNIANYVHLSDTMTTLQGNVLQLDYYVLPYNKDTATQHFKQVKQMLRCYEQSFGEYPFLKDGYALVETPYWGMEHQSAIAYGNSYKNHPFGFDFIIIHESGHEYWGNAIAVGDHAEMWIHEAFCTYAEALYLECTQGYKRANDYLMLQKGYIKNQHPILAPLHVNYTAFPDADMYYKGTWLLHTLRNVVNDDKKWHLLIKQLYQEFQGKITNTPEVIHFFSQQLGKNMDSFFYEYLQEVNPPTLEYYFSGKGKKRQLHYRFATKRTNFEMPLEIAFGKDFKRITANTKWQMLSFPEKQGNFAINERKFYVLVKEKTGK
jgi:aminopeptidase N